MNPHEYSNGDGGSDDSGAEDVGEEELELNDPGAPARVLAALNALRKSRQHYDLVVEAGGAQLPAHRAVLAAAAPALLPLLPAEGALRLPTLTADAAKQLIEFAYTGMARVRDGAAARALYTAAAQLRVEPLRAALAERLVRRVTPADCLLVRALPELGISHTRSLDAFLAEHWGAVCAGGALSTLPQLQLDMLQETSATHGHEAPLAVAEAALAWLRDHAPNNTLEELCSRVHLLYVDARGELRDCGELPPHTHHEPALQQYREDAVTRRANELPSSSLAQPAGEWCVVAARREGNGVTRALVSLGGRLVAARVAWRAGGAGVARGGALGAGGAMRREPLSEARAACGAASLAGQLVVCGGYDSARVLRSAAAYDPSTNQWSTLPAMRGPRARCAAAALNGTLLLAGGSDGHVELSSVEALVGGRWEPRCSLPIALSYAGAAADETSGALYVLGGWAQGACLKTVFRYSIQEDTWTEAPSLTTGRSQCAGVWWEGCVWALGGCDAWRCLASTEKLDGARWVEGPALPTARRSVGAAVWAGRLVAAGGSAGGASMRQVYTLTPGGTAWSPASSLRRARAAPALVALSDALYAVGGFDGKEFLACVECLYSCDGEWTVLCSPPTILDNPAILDYQEQEMLESLAQPQMEKIQQKQNGVHQQETLKQDDRLQQKQNGLQEEDQYQKGLENSNPHQKGLHQEESQQQKELHQDEDLWHKGLQNAIQHDKVLQQENGLQKDGEQRNNEQLTGH